MPMFRILSKPGAILSARIKKHFAVGEKPTADETHRPHGLCARQFRLSSGTTFTPPRGLSGYRSLGRFRRISEPARALCRSARLPYLMRLRNFACVKRNICPAFSEPRRKSLPPRSSALGYRGHNATTAICFRERFSQIPFAASRNRPPSCNTYTTKTAAITRSPRLTKRSEQTPYSPRPYGVHFPAPSWQSPHRDKRQEVRLPGESPSADPCLTGSHRGANE